MAINFNEINAGAKFHRADLHIHSFGDEGSYDVSDTSMSPQNIVDTAIANDLSIISITDHNEIGNVKHALAYADGKNILVIPGIEVSTTQGHLLVYFEDFLSLKSFYGRLGIASDRETCSQSIVDCLELAQQFGGIGVLAHIELTSGFESTINRFGKQMEAVLCHSNVVAIEVSNKQNATNYTDADLNPDRKRLINLRRQTLDLIDDWHFPVLMSSDSHMLSKLGLNAEGNKRLTRIKMDSLCFHGFKVALQNSQSRIMLEDLIPERTPGFIGIKLEGGLLDDLKVHLNKNLTCIIGGRGAGKSTLLECIRSASGNGSDSAIVDSEVWPDKISLLYQDEAGQTTYLTREKNGSVTNVNDPDKGITTVDIETYGQGETANTIQYSDGNPTTLLSFLESFIDFGSLKDEEEEVRQKLIINQGEMGKLRVDVVQIAEIEKQKIYHEGKLNQLKQENVGQLVTYQTALLQERTIRNNIISDLNKLVQQYKGILDDSTVFKDFAQLQDKDIVVGKVNFIKVKQLVSEFSMIVSSKSTELRDSLNEKISELKTQLHEWAGKESEILSNIDAKKAELAAQGIPFDIGKINQIASTVNHFQEKLKSLLVKKTELDELIKQRSFLIQQRTVLLTKIYNARLGFSVKIKEDLKNSVDGFLIDLKFHEGKYSPLFEEAIRGLMQWRTVQVPKARLLARFISPSEFAKCVKKGNLDCLKGLLHGGARVFSDVEIEQILLNAKSNYAYEEFESTIVDDLPVLTVTKMVDQGNGTQRAVSRSIAQLSLGQQQSIVLAILLHSNSKKPLLIDQPEDNLDSEFIAKHIVPNLKKIKESRQVIIVTHNANIAVLGDAELIVPLKSTSLKSQIVGVGSVDRAETRAICCEILEGGTRAFKKRGEIYGLDS